MTYTIIKEGLFFRALNNMNGERSSLFTSASQAGGYIAKKAGKAQQTLSFEAFVKK